jgi:hypothetical protein
VDDEEQRPVDARDPETEPTPKNATYTVLPKYRDPIGNMIMINRFRAIEGLPPLTVDDLSLVAADGPLRVG